jgi:hypothetical protein
VPPFGGRAFAAVAVWLGLALLDLGPRATAAFWPALSPPEHSSAYGATGGAGKPAADASDENPSVWPPVDDARRCLEIFLQPYTGAQSGGAGSPPPQSQTGSGSAPALGTLKYLPIGAPDPCSRLRIPSSRIGPNLLIRSIFEPPRLVG